MGDTKEKQVDRKDVENHEETQLPYPKSVFLIIATEFCERFSYYGMRTVLSLYFKFLNYSEETSIVLFHSFVSLCYFAPIFGATLADSFLGKFRTIFYLCIVYILGELVLTLGAVGDGEDGISGMPAAAVSFIGLFLIALGTGGIKPCVAPFGAEQFELPQQESQMKTFFSWFYASINSGAMISSILTPYLRAWPCLGQDTCFPLAFGVPSALMVVALCFFVLGKVFNLYKIRIPDENIIVKTTKCIWHGFKEWRARRKNEKHDSMLDYAKGRFSDDFIEDVKALKGVVYVFLPVPIFWSLFDQQGSSWTFQATRMKSRLGESFELLPDTIQVANAVLILVFIPIFEYIIYPLFAKVKLLRTPLQRIVVGGILAGVAFLISGFIELKLQEKYPVLPPENEVIYSFHHGFVDSCKFPELNLSYLEGNVQKFIPLKIDQPTIERRLTNIDYDVLPFEVTCGETKIPFEKFTISKLAERNKPQENQTDSARTVLFTLDADKSQKDNLKSVIYPGEFVDKYDKPKSGYPFIKVFWNLAMTENATITFKVKEDDNTGEIAAKYVITKPSSARKGDDDNTYKINGTLGDLYAFSVPELGKYQVNISIDGADPFYKEVLDFQYGGNYQLTFQRSTDEEVNKMLKPFINYEITPANDIHMLWQLPQYIVITAGEIMFSITTLSFAFTEAPPSMKAVMMAVQNLTVAFGDVIVIVLIPVLAALFDKQAYAFFFFAGLMFVDMALMAFMTRNYQYKDKTNLALSQS